MSEVESKSDEQSGVFRLSEISRGRWRGTYLDFLSKVKDKLLHQAPQATKKEVRQPVGLLLWRRYSPYVGMLLKSTYQVT